MDGLPSESVSPELRRVAVALHSASPVDRTWLMQRLPAGQQPVLNAMLRELAELGIPADRPLLADAITSGSARQQGRDGGAVVAMRQADATPAPSAACFAQIVKLEHPAVAALLLGVCALPLRDVLMSSLPLPKRRLVAQWQDAFMAGNTSKRLPARLQEVLADALRGQEASQPNQVRWLTRTALVWLSRMRPARDRR